MVSRLTVAALAQWPLAYASVAGRSAGDGENGEQAREQRRIRRRNETPTAGVDVADPQVAVIVTSQDHSELLGLTLRSVQLQDFTEWECIVVDDASLDDAVAVAQSFAAVDSRFTVLAHDRTRGLSGRPQHRHRRRPGAVGLLPRRRRSSPRRLLRSRFDALFDPAGRRRRVVLRLGRDRRRRRDSTSVCSGAWRAGRHDVASADLTAGASFCPRARWFVGRTFRPSAASTRH